MLISIRFKDSTSVDHVGNLSYMFRHGERVLYIFNTNKVEQWFYNLDDVRVTYIYEKDQNLNI